MQQSECQKRNCCCHAFFPLAEPEPQLKQMMWNAQIIKDLLLAAMTDMRVEETELGPIPGEVWGFVELKEKMIKDKPDWDEW